MAHGTFLEKVPSWPGGPKGNLPPKGCLTLYQNMLKLLRLTYVL